MYLIVTATGTEIVFCCFDNSSPQVFGQGCEGDGRDDVVRLVSTYSIQPFPDILCTVLRDHQAWVTNGPHVVT